MEKTVKVTVNLKHARMGLLRSGFDWLVQNGSDEEIFEQVLEMMTCYGAKTEIISEPTATSEKKGGWGYRDGTLCCRNCGFEPTQSLYNRDGYSNSNFCPNCGEKA